MTVDVAIVGTGQTPMRRRAAESEMHMVFDVTQAAVEDAGVVACGHRLHGVGLVRPARGAELRVRQHDRGDRRVAADLRVARGDGRRVGAVRGVDQAPGGRRRRRARVLPRAHVGRPALGGPPAAARPVLAHPARARPRCARRAAGAAADRPWHRHRARLRGGRGARPRQRGRQPERAGERHVRRRRAPRRALRARAAAPPRLLARSPTARPRSCWRRATRRPSSRTVRRGSPASTTASTSTSRGCATSPSRRRPRSRRRRPASPTGRSRWPRSPPSFSPQDVDPAAGDRSRRRRRDEPVGRRARRQPADGRGPGPRSSKPPTRCAARASTAPSRTPPVGRPCSRTSSPSWRTLAHEWHCLPVSSAPARPKYKKARTDVSMPGPAARGRAARARRRRARLDRHRRGRVRQGARPVRGRHAARAVHGRRARRGGQADAAGAHRRQRGLLDRGGRHRHGAGRALPAGARGARGRSSPRATRSGVSAAAAATRWAPAASSPRGCAPTSSDRVRPSTSAGRCR